MPRKSYEIRLIGIGLAVLYGISALVYWYADQAHASPHAALLLVLFGLLLAGSLAAAFLNEWGRRLLVSGNVVLGVYLIKLSLDSGDFMPVGYILMSMITLLFFDQSNIRMCFHPAAKTAKKTILIIDDDEILRKTVEHVLRTHGYVVLLAATGEEGLQLAESQCPDLIILDVILPKMKGREVCRRIKENKITRHIPVVFLTAKDSPDDIRAEMEAGGETHLTKPVNSKVLAAAIQEILGG